MTKVDETLAEKAYNLCNSTDDPESTASTLSKLGLASAGFNAGLSVATAGKSETAILAGAWTVLNAGVYKYFDKALQRIREEGPDYETT